MSVLDQLTPQQKQYAMVGVVVVAVFALINRFRSAAAAPASTSEQSSTTTTTATPTGSFAVGSTNAIGVGQLSEFESLLTGVVGGLSTKVDQLTQTIQNAPPPAAATPPPPPASETRPVPVSPAPAPPADPCAGRNREVPGYAPAPPGMWAEPIVVQGTTIGVSYHPC